MALRRLALATQLSRRARREELHARIAEALLAEEGVAERAAAWLGCSREKVYWHAARRPELARLLVGHAPSRAHALRRWRRSRRTRVIPPITGAGEQLRALVLAAVAEARGCVRRAAESLGLTSAAFDRYLARFPESRALAEQLRRRGQFAPWLVRASAVLDHAPMVEQLVAAAQGLELEEIVAEVEASRYAGSVDAQALAEAIYAAMHAGE